MNVLKIDRSFVEQITGNDRGRKIINAIIAMAHALGMSVVGEGIETDRQLGELTALGCDEGQGFFFGRPVPPDQVASFSPAGPVTPLVTAQWPPRRLSTPGTALPSSTWSTIKTLERTLEPWLRVDSTITT